jgi:hypothetical protein
MAQLIPLTEEQATAIDNSQPANQSVQIGHLLKGVIDSLNTLLSDDTQNPNNPPPTSP